MVGSRHATLVMWLTVSAMMGQSHVPALRSQACLLQTTRIRPLRLLELCRHLRGGEGGYARTNKDEGGGGEIMIRLEEDEVRKRELYDCLGLDADADPSLHHTLEERDEIHYEHVRMCVVRGNVGDGISSGKELLCETICTQADEIMSKAMEEVDQRRCLDAPRVYINYYDLRGAEGFLTTGEDASDPMEFGMWQLGVFLNGWEWSFCAYNGIIRYNARSCPFGYRLHSIAHKRTGRSEAAIESFIEQQRNVFEASSFNAWNFTSIDFAEAFLSFLTGEVATLLSC
eukprot:3594-Hanusia_phi.AAC.1